MTAADVSVVAANLPGSEVELTIEVPPDQVDRAFDRVLDGLVQRVRIGGFRPGKAPRPLVEARVGPAAIRDQVMETLVPPLVSQALQDHRIDPIATPEVEVKELARGRPARIVARASVMPDVELPDLDTLELERPRTTVDEEMVGARLRELLDRLAEIQPVERAAREGDLAVVDLKVIADGEEVPSEARRAVEIELADGRLLPELRAALVGHQVGDVVSAEVAMPADHTNPALRGKLVRFEMTLQGVKEKVVPELTDEIAAQVSEGRWPSVEELRQAVRQDLEEEARLLDAIAFERAALTAVVTRSQLEMPRALVEREIDQEVEDLARQLPRRGLTLERYLRYLGKDLAEYREGLRADAEARVRTQLVVAKLIEALGVTASEQEVTEHMRSEAARDEELGRNLDRLLASPNARSAFRRQLLRARAVRALVARLGGDGQAAPAAESR
jgi:trigger factor